MKHGLPLAVALLALTLPRLVTASDQRGGTGQRNESPSATDSRDTSTAVVKIAVAAEGIAALPPDSKVQWEGTENECRGVAGEQMLRPTGATPLTLPVCKVRLKIFITGFDTKTATVDLAGNEDKYGDPVNIAIKRKGLATVEWNHGSRANPDEK